MNSISHLGLNVVHETDFTQNSMHSTQNMKESELLMALLKVTQRLELFLQQLPLV